MGNEYSINTKKVEIPAGAHPAIVQGFVGLGKQPNKFDPSKPPSTRFTLVYRMALEGGEQSVWCKSYTASWGPKASFYKDTSVLFTSDEIAAGQIAPTQLLGRPCQMIFTASRDESGVEKVGLAAVGSLPKSNANIEAVKTLREKETFSFDAGRGERPGLEAMNALPKWLLEQIEQAGPVQSAAPPTSNWTAPNPTPQAPATASPTVAFMAGQQPQAAAAQTQTAQPANGEPFDDSLSDLTW